MGIFLLRLDGTGGKKALYIHLMQSAIPIGITIDMGQNQSGLQLAANLLLNGMGKLHAAVRFLQLFAVRFVLEGVKRHCIDDLCLVIIDQIVDTIIQTRQ